MPPQTKGPRLSLLWGAVKGLPAHSAHLAHLGLCVKLGHHTVLGSTDSAITQGLRSMDLWKI